MDIKDLRHKGKRELGREIERKEYEKRRLQSLETKRERKEHEKKKW
jgi:hypothetical protein